MSRAILVEWCQLTVFHGVRDAYEAKNSLLKFMWSIVVVAGFFFAITQSLELILSFILDDKWETRISTESPPDGSLEWPNVTFCFPNRLHTSHLSNANVTQPREIAYLASGGDDGLKFYDQFFKSDTSDVSHIDHVDDSARNKLLGIRQITCEDTILDCGHNHGFRFSLACNCSHISLDRETNKKRCFTISSSKAFGNTAFGATGYDSAGQFLINPLINQYYHQLLFDEKAYGGIKMQIHFGEDESDGLSTPIFVGPATMLAIGMTIEKHRTVLRKKHTLRFYEPQTPCVARYDYKWIHSSASSRSLCQWNCYGTFLMEFCQCIFKIANVKWKRGVKVCTAEEDNQCWNNMKLTPWKTRQFPSGFNYTHCVLDCKDPCEFKLITTRLSTTQFPAPTKVQSLTKYLQNVLHQHNLTENDVKQLILISLFYESNEYRLFETVNRLSLDELISDIGGTLGVWTGLSLIGIFQAILYLLYFLEDLLRRGYDRLANRAILEQKEGQK